MVNKHQLLIIDENKRRVGSLMAKLEQKYEVLTAYNGFDGLIAFKENEHSIDLVISDLAMHELSGVCVINFLKGKYPDVSIIVLTGMTDDLDVTGIKVRADKFIKKPFEIDELDQSVAELLADRDIQLSTQSDLH